MTKKRLYLLAGQQAMNQWLWLVEKHEANKDDADIKEKMELAWAEVEEIRRLLNSLTSDEEEV